MQNVFSDIDPEVTTGLMLAALLDDFKDALMSGLSGTSRPLETRPGGFWIDTSLEAAPNYKWSLRLYNGTTDLLVFEIDVLTGASGFNKADNAFTIRRISDDTVGPILNLMKSRVANAGQVKVDDIVGRITIKSRTATGTDPVVAFLQATSTNDMTSASRGIIFSISSTPLGTNTVNEHLRFIAGTVESILPHKFNALILGQDSVAGTTNMVVPDDKVYTEITGSSGDSIHGVEVDALINYKIISNSGTTVLRVRHESLVASANQRIMLPDAVDLNIPVGGSISLYYSAADSRWKYLTGAVSGIKKDNIEIFGGYTEWVSPITGRIRVVSSPARTETAERSDKSTAYGSLINNAIYSWGQGNNGQLGSGVSTSISTPLLVSSSLFFKEVRLGGNSSWGRTPIGVTHVWGLNQYGQLGLGDTIPRSSPVAIAGGLPFTQTEIKETSYGILEGGLLFSWGRNDYGQLGDGSVIPKSTPVAVSGGLKYSLFFTGQESEQRVFAIERDTGTLFAWGRGTDGGLGTGDTQHRSSAWLVLGTPKYQKVVLGQNSAIGLTSTGQLYAWGLNDVGQLGDGTTVNKSSPVAVLGGMTFKNIRMISDKSFIAITKDGAIYAWGDNTLGQLGDGTTVNKSSPVAVLGGMRFSRIASLSGRGSVIAQDLSGVSYAWGRNDNAELGVGDTAHRSSPTLILGSKIFAEIRQGSDFTYGFANDKRVYAWGNNSSGQLGDGTTVSKSSPVLVLGGSLLNPPQKETTVKYLSVTAGTTYVVRCSGGNASFGNESLGNNVGKITISYEN